jgi:RNA polymerase-binding transcription factor DksA
VFALTYGATHHITHIRKSLMKLRKHNSKEASRDEDFQDQDHVAAFAVADGAPNAGQFYRGFALRKHSDKRIATVIARITVGLCGVVRFLPAERRNAGIRPVILHIRFQK